MYFWMRRLLGQQPPFFDKVGGRENAERIMGLLGDTFIANEMEAARKRKSDIDTSPQGEAKNDTISG